MGLFESALGSIGSAIGGLLGNDDAKKQLAADRAYAQRVRAEDIALQKEFAQNSIQWKVQDAKAAGLHPLAALGVSPYQYTPVGSMSVSSPSTDYSFLGDIGRSMGQSIDSSVMAGKTAAARRKAERISDVQTGLALRHQELQNQILEMEIASKKARLSQQSVPAMPLAMGRDGTIVVDGQGDSFSPAAVNRIAPAPTSSGLIQFEPAHVVANELGRPSQVAGSNPDYSFQRVTSSTGLIGYTPVRQVGGQDPYEDDLLGAFSWNLRNRVLPYFATFDGRNAPPDSWLPRGYDGWQWNVVDSAWYPYKKSDSFFRKFRNFWIPR